MIHAFFSPKTNMTSFEKSDVIEMCVAIPMHIDFEKKK
jgi:hypothetical protein